LNIELAMEAFVQLFGRHFSFVMVLCWKKFCKWFHIETCFKF